MEIGSLFQVCICECDDNAKVTSDQLVPRGENTSDAFKSREAENSGCTVLIILQTQTGMLRTASIQQHTFGSDCAEEVEGAGD